MTPNVGHERRLEDVRSMERLDLSELRMTTGSFAQASVANGQPIRAARRRLD